MLKYKIPQIVTLTRILPKKKGVVIYYNLFLIQIKVFSKNRLLQTLFRRIC